MRMATETRPWTRADLTRLPDDGNRYEVLDGALLVTPQASFSHQDAATNLLVLLRGYCREHGIGVAVGPGAVPFGDNELQPDVVVVPVQPPAGEVKWEELPLPILVVEVLSGSTRRRDLGIKRQAYLRIGIPEYWLVDRGARTVRVAKPGGTDRVENETLQWTPRANVPPLVIRLAELFPGRTLDA